MLKQHTSSSKIFFIFLISWTILNGIQAGFMELHPDEAYYWLYSRFLDWGYFDHPPMVAFFIKAGDMLFSSKFGLRLVSIITHSVSIFLLWEILKKYSQNVKLFILLFSSILIFHVYGFIATPDSPLLFFSVLFFYVYQRYAEQDKVKWAFLLALIIAGMLYSKYHGVLILFFTILSNFKLLKRPSFWLIVVLSCLLFVPHIYWQIENGFPSVYYHLFDRSAKPYEWNFTADYLLAQLLIAGPLLGWYLYASAIRLKLSDPFIRAIRFNFYGIFFFFLLSTFKGSVEAHWTLLAFPPLFILSYLYLSQKTEIPRWFIRLSVANISLILLVRLILIVPIPGIKDLEPVAYYYGSENWAKQIKAQADNQPVVLTGGFQEASLYDFYNRTTRGFAYDSRYYRKNQFDIWPLEDSLRNKKVYYLNGGSHGADFIEDTLKTDKGIFYGTWLEHARMYQKVMISPVEPISGNWKAGTLRTLKLKIYNPYNETISLGNKGQQWKCFLEYSYMNEGSLQEFSPLISNVENINIGPGEYCEVSSIIRSPLKAGDYKLIFSIRTEPFAGSRNSNMIAVQVTD
ncbi:MAG TPA: glycosyltransferase family 39 protein [Daejeonella sp.]|nr:glycosyltransferase family 39 protein [Daejeonella sp.]